MTKKWGKMSNWPTVAARIDPRIIVKINERLQNCNGEYKMSRLIRALLVKYAEGKVFVTLEEYRENNKLQKEPGP